MNPYSPKQNYPQDLVEKALERCRLEQENTEFLIHVNETLMNTIQQGRESLNGDMFDAPIILADEEIVLPSTRAILEHEERHHANSIEKHKQLLIEIKEACLALDNAARRHGQNYDYKFQKLMKDEKLIKYEKLNNNFASSSSNV